MTHAATPHPATPSAADAGPGRRIVANFFISLDGVVESPDKWHFAYFNEEMGEAIGAGFATSDALLMGTTLYREWSLHLTYRPARS